MIFKKARPGFILGSSEVLSGCPQYVGSAAMASSSGGPVEAAEPATHVTPTKRELQSLGNRCAIHTAPTGPTAGSYFRRALFSDKRSRSSILGFLIETEQKDEGASERTKYSVT
jgi:hypothetical protein